MGIANGKYARRNQARRKFKINTNKFSLSDRVLAFLGFSIFISVKPDGGWVNSVIGFDKRFKWISILRAPLSLSFLINGSVEHAWIWDKHKKVGFKGNKRHGNKG